ncbi:unnamed protein product [Ranitomeya imitator]|uniref:Uncharacterized protein n=1 Tax=Ranitomeya imitator TaxID=111125 RepID=A0ABN9L1L1_9NEOB|nr:unnamed protein product [Ranitomeya imitator]
MATTKQEKSHVTSRAAAQASTYSLAAITSHDYEGVEVHLVWWIHEAAGAKNYFRTWVSLKHLHYLPSIASLPRVNRETVRKLLLVFLVLNMCLTREVVFSSPICTPGSLQCQVLLSDLFDRAIRLSHYIHSLSTEMFEDILLINIKENTGEITQIQPLPQFVNCAACNRQDNYAID